MSGNESGKQRLRRGEKDAAAQAPQANRQPGQEERALRTRALILGRASEAFGLHGYDGVSLNDIIKATGLTKGAFYHHFESKEALATEVFRQKQGELLTRIRELATPELDARRTLEELFDLRARILTSEPSLGSFLRLASDLVARSGPGSEFAQSYELPITTFAELIRRGQAEGVFKPQIDPRAAAEAVFAASLGTDELAKVQSGGADLEQRTQRWLGILLAGLATGPPEARARPTKRAR